MVNPALSGLDQNWPTWGGWHDLQGRIASKVVTFFSENTSTLSYNFEIFCLHVGCERKLKKTGG